MVEASIIRSKSEYMLKRLPRLSEIASATARESRRHQASRQACRAPGASCGRISISSSLGAVKRIGAAAAGRRKQFASARRAPRLAHGGAGKPVAEGAQLLTCCRRGAHQRSGPDVCGRHYSAKSLYKPHFAEKLRYKRALVGCRGGRIRTARLRRVRMSRKYHGRKRIVNSKPINAALRMAGPLKMPKNQWRHFSSG